MKLTKKQNECYNILKVFYKDNGYWPTYREISKLMGLKSSAGPYKHIKALKEKGLVHKETYHSRSIKLIEPIEQNSELLKAHYWIIYLQEHAKTFDAEFNIEAFDSFTNSNRINVFSGKDTENIKSIKSTINQ